MNRALPLLTLLAVSVVAGVWLFGSETVPEPGSCEATSTCSGGVEPAGEAPPPVAVAGSPASPAHRPPAEPPPAARENAAELRSAADRLIAAGQVPEGLDALRKATELEPSARNHGDLGTLLTRLTAIDEAIVHLEQAAELDPGNADRWIELANAYYRKVDPGKAWKAERRARDADPGLVLTRDSSGMRVRRGDSAAPTK